MSSNDMESEDSKKSNKFVLKSTKELTEYSKEKLLQYIDDLHHSKKKNDKKLLKYKDKVKKLVEALNEANSTKNAVECTVTTTKKETVNHNGDDKVPSNEENEIAESAAFSFVDEMRQAAQQAQNVSNFIYEPTSGLYYDQKSGYYYNAEYGLYYDGNTGCYYRYNEAKQTYEFHSQVQVQPTATVTKDSSSVQYVNNLLLKRFSKLSIDRMRTNALELQDDATLDALDAEVIFDEFGVVTDSEKLKRLRLERDQQQKHRHSKNKKSSRNKEGRSKSQSKKHKRNKHSRTDNERTEKLMKPDMEDGELSKSSSSSDSSSSNMDSDSNNDEEKRKVPVFKKGSRFQDIAKKYPPSLRIIVQETNLEELKVGSLSLITYKGGSLGREGNHDVIVPDVNVSKYHLKFIYDNQKFIYKCVDLGSRNGTLLNGQRMSAAKKESNAYDLVHGSTLQIAQTKLLCHIHEGNSTCGLCEPGLLIEATRDISAGSCVVLSHKEQLKKLQKKYGLENEKFVDNIKQPTAGLYSDRAATRRLKVGSSSDKEKTQTASVDTEIPSHNKGFKMLSKLGWNKGETLGKSTQGGGLLEPINVESNPGTKGLGCQNSNASASSMGSDKRKMELMKKTKQRYLNANIVNDENI